MSGAVTSRTCRIFPSRSGAWLTPVRWDASTGRLSPTSGYRAGGLGPRESAGSFFYLRTPDTPTVGAGTSIGEKVGLLGGVAAGPVFLHVGTASVEPTEGHTYDPTDGCTTDPYPSVPVVCASANVLVRVNAVASAIVVTFMVVSFDPTYIGDNAPPARPFRSILL